VTQTIVMLEFVQKVDDIGPPNVADQAMTKPRKDVIAEAALYAPVAF